jgi:hypothetical protein
MLYNTYLTGGLFQDSFQNPVSFGKLVLTLKQTDYSAIGYLYANLSPAIPVVEGLTFSIPLDAFGSVVTSPAYGVLANNMLTPNNSYYLVSCYNKKGKLVWGPNAQQVNIVLSPLQMTFDIGQWVPNQITET